MKAYIFIALFSNLALQTFAQNDIGTDCFKKIKQYSAKLVFPEFVGLKSISKDTIKFDSSIIIINDTKSDLVKVIERGLIFPDLVFGASTQGDKFEIKFTPSADTLSISSLKELRLPNLSPNSRVFTFLLWEPKLENPLLYLFELTSENSNSQSSFEAFIKTAKVTAFGFCSILI